MHIESDLNDTDGTNLNPPNAPDGLYLIGMKVTLAGSGLPDSDPIWLIYNNNVDDATANAAIAWANAHLVPEPTMWVLMAAAMLGLLATHMRRGNRLAS